jgi:hypothetical protein
MAIRGIVLKDVIFLLAVFEFKKMKAIKLWGLNNEFDIEIYCDDTFNYPSLKISEKSGKLILDTKLWGENLYNHMITLFELYPNSIFLKNLFKQNGR